MITKKYKHTFKFKLTIVASCILIILSSVVACFAANRIVAEAEYMNRITTIEKHYESILHEIDLKVDTLKYIEDYTKQFNLDPALVLSIACYIESNNTAVEGRHGPLGIDNENNTAIANYLYDNGIMEPGDTEVSSEVIGASLSFYISRLLGQYLDINEVVKYTTNNDPNAAKEINIIYKSITGNDIPSLIY